MTNTTQIHVEVAHKYTRKWMPNYELLSVFALQAKLPPLLVRRIKVSELSWSVRSLHKYKYKRKHKNTHRNMNTNNTNTNQPLLSYSFTNIAFCARWWSQASSFNMASSMALHFHRQSTTIEREFAPNLQHREHWVAKFSRFTPSASCRQGSLQNASSGVNLSANWSSGGSIHTLWEQTAKKEKCRH